MVVTNWDGEASHALVCNVEPIFPQIEANPK